MTCRQTQAEILLAHCRRKPMTYGDLQALGVSTSPHKRLAEGERRYLKEGERLVRVMKRGLVAFRVVKVN